MVSDHIVLNTMCGCFNVWVLWYRCVNGFIYVSRETLTPAAPIEYPPAVAVAAVAMSGGVSDHTPPPFLWLLYMAGGGVL